MGRRNRKDLKNLYGMDEVPDEVYDTIMRADNGSATEDEYLLLEVYIEKKKRDIRTHKMALGIEGKGSGRGPGKLAEGTSILFEAGSKLCLDDEENIND